MPDHFFLVGAQRSGTTYLYRMLDAHPAIAMNKPLRPEPRFFTNGTSFARGLDWYEETFFSHATPGQIRGDKSVGYLDSEAAADRIAATLPGARFVAILRNPVDRAVSHYWFTVENGLEQLPIEQALTADEEPRAARDGEWFLAGGRKIAAHPFIYRRRGHYVDDLRLYRDRFGRRRLHVMVFENTVGSAQELARLYAFLGVDAGFVPDQLGTVVNAGHGSQSTPSESLRRELESHFAPYNDALAAEFELDLSAWRSR